MKKSSHWDWMSPPVPEDIVRWRRSLARHNGMRIGRSARLSHLARTGAIRAARYTSCDGSWGGGRPSLTNAMHGLGLYDHAWGMKLPTGRAAGVVIEPYSVDAAKIAKGRRLLAPLGISLLMPPNPLASVYYPGRCYIAVALRAEDAPLWRWLPEQLAFEGGHPDDRFTPGDVEFEEAML